MSDIVTTLQDKDGNNIYPIAGGVNGNTITAGMLQSNSVTTAKITDSNITTDKLAGNAVTTAKIDSGAVTKDKIDFTTLTNFAFPYAHTTYTMPFGIDCDFYRIGNIVIVQNSTLFSGAFPQNGSHAVSEVIPLGYRPIQRTQLSIISDDVRIGAGGFQIDTDGTMTVTAAFDRNDNFRLSINGIWITADAWPSGN